jgi:hypothetical protein
MPAKRESPSPSHNSLTQQVPASTRKISSSLPKGNPVKSSAASTMSKPSEKRQKLASVVEVIDAANDGQGDLFIKPGKQESKVVRVHSIILKMTSPVFKTMLGPAF